MSKHDSAERGSSTPQILNETVCTLKQAAERVPTKPHVATVWNWTRRGGIRLETYRVAGRVVTSHEAVKRFLDRHNSHHVDELNNATDAMVKPPVTGFKR